MKSDVIRKQSRHDAHAAVQVRRGSLSGAASGNGYAYRDLTLISTSNGPNDSQDHAFSVSPGTGASRRESPSLIREPSPVNSVHSLTSVASSSHSHSTHSVPSPTFAPDSSTAADVPELYGQSDLGGVFGISDNRSNRSNRSANNKNNDALLLTDVSRGRTRVRGRAGSLNALDVLDSSINKDSSHRSCHSEDGHHMDGNNDNPEHEESNNAENQNSHSENDNDNANTQNNGNDGDDVTGSMYQNMFGFPFPGPYHPDHLSQYTVYFDSIGGMSSGLNRNGLSGFGGLSGYSMNEMNAITTIMDSTISIASISITLPLPVETESHK